MMQTVFDASKIFFFFFDIKLNMFGVDLEYTASGSYSNNRVTDDYLRRIRKMSEDHLDEMHAVK
jgi:hypothetical protein